jgi:geranylgeranyl pyrophosphate synthase
MTDLYRDDVSIDEYLVRASDKTAALFELAARLGALAGGFGLGGQSLMASYGAHVGLAFQLADDLRDIVGGPGLGRERGTDIREGVYTLPVLIALTERRRGHEHLRRAMHQARLDRDQATVDGCCEILMTNGSVATAARVMWRNVEMARVAAEEMVGTLRVSLATFVEGVAYGLDDVLEGPV